MSTAGTDNDDDEEEENFFESLDRIHSSSNSSTSDEEDDVVVNSPSNNCPNFPISVHHHDVWASGAAFSATSLHQRRHRLLCSLGLSSVYSSMRIPDFSVIQSKSEVSTFSECDSCHRCVSPNDKCSLLSDYTVCTTVSSLLNNTVNSDISIGKNSNRRIQGDFAHSDLSSVCCDVLRDCSSNYGQNVEFNMNNPDTGKFVVNEVRENGMWNKIREIGPDRQLTIEEYEMSVRYSPIVEESMMNIVEERIMESLDVNGDNGGQSKKKLSWFKSIKSAARSVIGYKGRDTSSERGGQRSISATDGSKDGSFHGPDRVRIRRYGKSVKDLTGLYKIQEIHAHNGSIWSIKFSLDGRFLASAGEDFVIHVWEVVELEKKGELLRDGPDNSNLTRFLKNGSPRPNSPCLTLRNPVKNKRCWSSMSLDHVVVPQTVFGISEKPYCSFRGHLDGVLDLSWSKSQHLLSSSMDKTVRLWNLSSKTCLKTFSHFDYVTCIQFNPVDDKYFISGSLDGKVRIWSITDRQVIEWIDLHEMVTAACYSPDGQEILFALEGCISWYLQRKLLHI